jgi:hypothetical protein
MVSTLIKTAIVGAVAATLVAAWPDIQRYIKMSQM